MRKILLIAIFASALMAAPSAYDQGKRLYFSKGCNSCHGVSATGSAQYPSLAHRRKSVLINKLKRLRTKQGDTQLAQMMIPFALSLTDAQIDALTTFLSDYHEVSRSSYVPDDSMTEGGGS